MRNRLSRILLVGQAPSKDGDPGRPLIGGRSGTRLQLLCGLTLAGYVRAFERVNLLDRWPGKGASKGDLFPRDEARERAAAMLPRLRGRKVILCGREVMHAFGLVMPPLRWTHYLDLGCHAAMIPHPSPVNRWWNSEVNEEMARTFMLRAVREQRGEVGR